MSQDKVLLNLDASLFQAFKSRLHTEFPAWGVKKFAPTVYVSRQHNIVNIFSITGYVITPAEIDRAKEIAAELEKNPPPASKPNGFKFSPIKGVPRKKGKISIRMGMGRAWYGK